MTAAAGVRALAKRAIERAAVGAGLTALARRAQRGKVLVLAYHNVVPDGEPVAGDRSLHLPQRAFAAQLEILVQTHDVVSLREGLAAPARESGRPSAVITFDDAYRGALTAGIDELAKRGLPAAVFVPPAFVGDGTFWWDALAIEGRADAFRTTALTACRGEDARVRAEARRRGLREREVPAHARCVTLDELTRAARQLAVGSHSWSHLNLAALTSDALAEELVRPLAWLREHIPGFLPWLAYPYGQSSARVAAAARKAGYDGALLIEGGWSARPPRDPHAVPRLDVPGSVSQDGFAMRIAGLVGR